MTAPRSSANPTLHPAICELLAGLRTGAAKIHNDLGLWPVFAEPRHEPSYITLVEAMELEGFKITEVSHGGSVPDLRVINETTHCVLLFDGEELKGAKQNRILNTTILGIDHRLRFCWGHGAALRVDETIVHLAMFGGGGPGEGHHSTEPPLRRHHRSYL